ncbi:MAG: DUF2309 family protein, partial [Chloroflexus sp.]|nr:DUF2309 family protein [Chloroflexus sp.]
MSVLETQFSAQAVVVTPIPTVSRDRIICAVKQAEQRIAPLWPLRNFVAVNPFLGLADVPFATAAQLLLGRAGARMTAPRAFYARLISDGRITDADLATAIAEHSSLRHAPKGVAELKAFAFSDTTEATYPVLPTVADVASTLTGINWADVVTDAISTWAGAYFDLGQSYWRSPWAQLPAYAAWRAEAIHDRSAQVRGLRQFR